MGRKKGQTYTRNKPLYKLYVITHNTNKLLIGEYSSYAKIGIELGVPRATAQNIALNRIKNKYKNVVIERINKTES